MRRTMRRTITLAMALAGVAACVGTSIPAAAQATQATQDPGVRTAPPPPRRAHRVAARPRIVVTPAQRLYRQCVDRYVVENRPSGPTVVPDTRCWWAYRLEPRALSARAPRGHFRFAYQAANPDAELMRHRWSAALECGT